MARRRGSGILKFSQPAGGPPPAVSIFDLARRWNSFQQSLDRRLYGLVREQPLALDITGKGWAVLRQRLVAPREHIETQDLIRVHDRLLDREAAYNPLVSYPLNFRPANSERVSKQRPPHEPASVAAEGWSDCLTVSRTPEFATHPRIVRTALVDTEVIRTPHQASAAHADHTGADNSSVASVWQFVDQVVEQALDHADYFQCSMHVPGSRDLAETDSHAVRVQGRRGRHFEFPEAIYRAGSADYWNLCADVHRKLWLLVTTGDVRAWFVLAPAAKIEIVALSDSLAAGALAMEPILAVLERWDLTLTAYVTHTDRGDRRFRDWPLVVWRLLADDTDDPYPELAADPFIVRDVIRGMAY